LGCFFRVRIEVFSVTTNSGSPLSKHAFHYRLQVFYVPAILVNLGECQPIPSPEVSQGGAQGFLLKHLAIRADPIIHQPKSSHDRKGTPRDISPMATLGRYGGYNGSKNGTY
jgi:hypothetical protein